MPSCPRRLTDSGARWTQTPFRVSASPPQPPKVTVIAPTLAHSLYLAHPDFWHLSFSTMQVNSSTGKEIPHQTEHTHKESPLEEMQGLPEVLGPGMSQGHLAARATPTGDRHQQAQQPPPTNHSVDT